MEAIALEEADGHLRSTFRLTPLLSLLPSLTSSQESLRLILERAYGGYSTMIMIAFRHRSIIAFSCLVVLTFLAGCAGFAMFDTVEPLMRLGERTSVLAPMGMP